MNNNIETIKSKKDSILKAFKNRLTYNNEWHSPIFVYNIFEENIVEITDENYLLFAKPPIICFSNREDAETYKWLMDIMNKEIESRIVEHFQEKINNFVDYRDLSIGGKL